MVDCTPLCMKDGEVGGNEGGGNDKKHEDTEWEPGVEGRKREGDKSVN